MKLTWTNILIGALVAYLVYKMFFAREHNVDYGAVVGISLAFVIGVFAFGAWVMLQPRSS